MERKFRVISEEIGYWEASENPLSADVGVIRENGQLWFYDVGDGEENADPRMEGANIVLSHFHRDHTGNIERIHEGALYGSKETCRHMGRGTIVEQERTEGRLRIFPLPSSHARGCLGLEVDGQYAFVGDALYGRMKAGRCVYNAQFLKEEIAVLKGLRVPYLLVSHWKGMVREREAVIEELEEIYSRRNKNSSEIVVGKTE